MQGATALRKQQLDQVSQRRRLPGARSASNVNMFTNAFLVHEQRRAVVQERAEANAFTLHKVGRIAEQQVSSKARLHSRALLIPARSSAAFWTLRSTKWMQPPCEGSSSIR